MSLNVDPYKINYFFLDPEMVADIEKHFPDESDKSSPHREFNPYAEFLNSSNPPKVPEETQEMKKLLDPRSKHYSFIPPGMLANIEKNFPDESGKSSDPKKFDPLAEFLNGDKKSSNPPKVREETQKTKNLVEKRLKVQDKSIKTKHEDTKDEPIEG